jgi:hypothetical protein
VSNDLTETTNQALSPFVRGCGLETATKLARALIGSYPKEPHEPEIYTRGIVSVLAEQPADIAKRAVDRVTRSCRFLPTRADLCDAITAIREEGAAGRAIQASIAEQERRRERAAAQDAQLEAERKAFRERLGAAHDDFMNIPWQRRYAGSPEEFLAGWTAAKDKAAFCESWGRREESAA